MALSSAQQMGDAMADHYNDLMWREEGNFQPEVDKTGAQENHMTSWGPLASHEQKRTVGPELPTLLSPDRALWPQ